MKFPLLRLHEFTVDALTRVDVLPDHAEVAATRLLEADLRGRTGHGIIRLAPYVKRIEAGGLNLRPDIELARDTPVSALVDGDNALGQVVMTTATETAIAKAEESGIGWVGTVRSNHAGAGGVYTALAMKRDLIALYMAVASANVMPPWGGHQRLLGTNPLAIAIPGGVGGGLQLDIATTVASHGTIKVMAQSGETMPEGWVVDTEGRPITDPKLADDGFLVPIGGYKGAGLNLAIGLLAGVLNGAAFGSDVIDHRAVPDQAANVGQAILVMRPDLFRDLDDFKADVDRHIEELRAAGDPGAVQIPGERAAALEQRHREDGLTLPDGLLAELRSLSTRLDLDDDLSA